MPIPPSTTSLPHTSLTPLSMDTANVSNPMRTTLIPPAFFIPPPRSSASTTPPLPTSTSQLQSAPHGAPLVQPFPPPNPPPSLATPMLHNGPITREGVHEALNRLLKVINIIPFKILNFINN
jgi:mRNA-decapping enzyme 1B